MLGNVSGCIEHTWPPCALHWDVDLWCLVLWIVVMALARAVFEGLRATADARTIFLASTNAYRPQEMGIVCPHHSALAPAACWPCPLCLLLGFQHNKQLLLLKNRDGFGSVCFCGELPGIAWAPAFGVCTKGAVEQVEGLRQSRFSFDCWVEGGPAAVYSVSQGEPGGSRCAVYPIAFREIFFGHH